MAKTSYIQVGDLTSIFRRGKKWYVYFRVDGRTTRESLKTSCQREATRLAERIESELRRGDYRSAPPRVLVADTIELYLASVKGLKRADKTVDKYRYALEQFLSACVARRVKYLDGVGLCVIDELRACREVAEKTIHVDLTVVKQLMKFAMQRHLIRTDPLSDLKLPKPKLTPQPFWKPAEVARILAAVSDCYRAIMTFLWLTGTRIGEARWLTPEDIDHENRVVWIRAKPGWRPKSGDVRSIPMSPELEELLASIPKNRRWVFQKLGGDGSDARANQISERRTLEHLKRVLKRLGLTGKLHTFRHSFISHAIVNGVPPAVVRSWVGHVDDRILARYTHIADEQSNSRMRTLFQGSNRRPECES